MCSLFQTYILVGYYMNMTGDYNIAWTTPHCVLTLRLIALTFDVYDGQRKTVRSSDTSQGSQPSLKSGGKSGKNTFPYGKIREFEITVSDQSI